MSTTTPNLGLILPQPNVDTGWGSTLNLDFTLIDDLFSADGAGTSIGVNIGDGKTLLIAGEMLLGSGDNTGTVVPPSIRGAARTGTDVPGADLTFKAANGTGTGGSGSFFFQTAPARSTGTIACVLQTELTINSASNEILVDIGNGGTASTDGQSNLRINGSSAGAGTEGGTVLLIANNSLNTAAFGNRSAILGGTTAFSDLATIWGKDSISFFVGSGTLAASNEKFKLGSAGQVYLWDTTLNALNPGASGQVITSSGSGGPPVWSDPGINQVASQTFAAGGNSYTGLPPTIKSIILSIRDLDPAGSVDVLVRLQTSSGWITTGYQSSSSAVNATAVQTTNATNGFTINITGAVANGIITLNNLGANTWVCNHSIGATTARTCVGGGGIDLASELTGVQIIPQSGSFVASGFFNLMYQ